MLSQWGGRRGSGRPAYRKREKNHKCYALKYGLYFIKLNKHIIHLYDQIKIEVLTYVAYGFMMIVQLILSQEFCDII